MGFIKKMIHLVQRDVLGIPDPLPFTEQEDNFAMEAEQSVSIELTDEPTSLFDSKVGGKPYLPKLFDYPTDNRDDGSHAPLVFLAQINFSQISSLSGFPQGGILQFYIAADNMHGLNSGKDLTDPSGFRVIYFHELLEVGQLMEHIPMPIEKESPFPVSGEWKMRFTPTVSVISPQDYRYESFFLEVYQRAYPYCQTFEDIPIEVRDKMGQLCDSGGSRIGGFPFFTQEDPRTENNKYSDYSVLLFQLDSDKSHGVEWGDNGVCNFFITPEQLRNRDFSKVLYHWDCY